MGKEDSKCPTCEHKLESVFSYPHIEIKSMKRQPIPNNMKGPLITRDLVCSHESPIRRFFNRRKTLPPELQTFFRSTQSDEIYFNGSTYQRNYQIKHKKRLYKSVEDLFNDQIRMPTGTFSQYENILLKIKPLIESGEIGEYLNWLESLVGKSVRKDEIYNRKNEISSKIGYSLNFHIRDAYEYLKETGLKEVSMNNPEISNCFDLTLEEGTGVEDHFHVG